MSETRALFEKTAERLFTDLCSDAVIVAAEKRVLPKELWSELVGNGITLMLTPEDKGGIDATLGDAAAVMRIAGRYAAPGPLLETMLGNRLLAQAGFEPCEGSIALAFVDVSGPRPGDKAWIDPPVLHDVAWGGVADVLLVVARHLDGAVLVRSEPSAWKVVPGSDTSGEPRDTLSATRVPAATAILPGGCDVALRAAAILRAAQMLGAIDWSLTRSVEYARERKQFGRQIGDFQVVQQMLAEFAGHVLASAGIVEAAAAAGEEDSTLVGAARSRLGDAADAAVTFAHQIHGALGFSREYALNFRTRRLMAWRDDYGSVESWRRTIADGFIGLALEDVWPAVVKSAPKAAG